MKKKISIIIPAYNREKQIGRCIESLLSQTYKNLEIIIINDGSIDGTKGIIDEFQKQNKDRIIVVHTQNQGVSMARNEGISIATGDYIGFLDSDDYVDSQMYEKLLNKSIEGDYDIVACNTLALYPDKQVIIDSGIQDNQSVKKLLIDAYAVLWNKLYKAEYIKPLRFKKDVWYEDVLFLYQLYTKVKRVGRIESVGCYYVQNEGSITHTYNNKLYQLIENMDDIIKYYKDQGLYDIYRDELEYSYVRYLFGTFIKRLAKSKDFKQFRKGTNTVIKKVKLNFPNYKKNKYLNMKNGKSLYLKNFNKLISQVIYLRERNKMN